MLEFFVELERGDIEKYLQRAASSLSQRTPIDGFRKGSAPYDVVCRHVGGEAVVYQEALQSIVAGTLPSVFRDAGSDTLGQPNIAIQKMVPPFGITYKATVAIVPPVTLGDIEKIKVKKRDASFDEKEVEDVLGRLRNMAAEEKAVDRPARAGDVLELAITVKQDGKVIDRGTSSGVRLVLGEGAFIPGFEEKVQGATKGETRTFELTFPAEYYEKNLAGKPAEFVVEIQNVFERTVPELTDVFVKSLGHAETVEDLKKQVRESLQSEKEKEAEEKFEIACMEALVKASTVGEIADSVIGDEVERMLREMKHNVSEQGIPFEDYLKHLKKSEEDLKKEFRSGALERITLSLVARIYGASKGIAVSDDELDKEIDIYRKAYQSQPDVLSRLDSDEYRQDIRNRIQSKKIFKTLVREINGS